MPPEDCRITDEEVISNQEYSQQIQGETFNFDETSRLDQESTESSVNGLPHHTGNEMDNEGHNTNVVGSGLLDEIRGSVMVKASADNENEANVTKPPNLDDFKIKFVIGKGTFGKVFLAEFSFDKKLYAIKVIRKDILIEYNQIKNTKLEKDIMFKCQHQFLVGMEYLFMSELRLFFVMPFIRGGELYRFFKAKRRFKEHEVKFYAVQIALALGYLHKKGIIHRDLKLENILVDMNGYLKIIDFGLAKMLENKDLTKTYCGTPEYLAPEMI